MDQNDAKRLVQSAYDAMEAFDAVMHSYGSDLDEQTVTRVEDHGVNALVETAQAMPPVEQYFREAQIDELRSEMQRKCVAAVVAIVKAGYLE